MWPFQVGGSGNRQEMYYFMLLGPGAGNTSFICSNKTELAALSVERNT